MRQFIFTALAFAASAVSAQEIADQTINADAYSFTGTGEGPAPVIEISDQSIRAAVFEFEGTGEGPRPVVEIVDQTINAGRFEFVGVGGAVD